MVWGTIAPAQAGGLIAEVGGKLSHGAIIAREYVIPAVMDIASAANRKMGNGLNWMAAEELWS